MKNTKTILVMASLAVSPVVVAQTAGETETTVDDSATISSFDDLSTGNQRIARSLMDAQTLPADGSTQPWSLDDIAAARSETGWGNVFKQMQAEGLVDAKNLGQVVSSQARNQSATLGNGMSGGTDMAMADDDATDDADDIADSNGDDSMGDDTVADNPTDDATMADDATAENVDGSFEELSVGNKKIARSLMDAQTLPADGSGDPLTLDQIAAAKGDTGWGNVFKQMQSEGLVQEKNLGQVVSNYQRNSVTVATETTSAATTASAASKTLPEQANGKASSQSNQASVAAAENGNGNAYGVSNNSVSAADGIATAGGTTTGTSAAGSTRAASAGNNGNSVAAASNASTAGNAAASSSVSTAAAGSGQGKGHAYGRNK